MINMKETTPVLVFLEVLYSSAMKTRVMLQAHLEPLVLQHLFNCHHLLAVNKASLVHHTKRPIADHLRGIIDQSQIIWKPGRLQQPPMLVFLKAELQSVRC